MLTLEELNRRFNRIEKLLNSVGLIQPGSLTANTVSADNIVADSITAAEILANTITLVKLATETTDRMFDTSAASDNLQGWPHASDVTKIDGGDIYTGSVTAAKITVTSLSALSADMGTLTAGIIKMGTGTKDTDLTGFQLDSSEIVGQVAGVDQVYISAADGKLYAGAGNVIIDATGIKLVGVSADLRFRLFYGATYRGYLATSVTGVALGVVGTGPLGLTADQIVLVEYATIKWDGAVGALIGGGTFAWQTALLANRMTLDSVTGHLSTYGYIYPGTGAAIQSTRYIYDTGAALALGAGGDLVGTTLGQTLTTKTLTSPTINGTIATTGLTLPAFTLGGAITGGSQNITSLNSISLIATGILSSTVTDSRIMLRGGLGENSAEIGLSGKDRATWPGRMDFNTPNAALGQVNRLIIIGGVDVATATWSNCKHIFDAASLPNGDPSVSGQLYYTAADGIVRRSA